MITQTIHIHALDSLWLGALMLGLGCGGQDGALSASGYPSVADASTPMADTAGPADTTPADTVGPAGPESGPDAPRVRSFFPETLLAAPFIETDGDGRASLEVPLADSITTWRGAVVASGLRGEHGATTFGIRVFQSFFVDLSLPVQVTRGDVLALPLVVYNYEPTARSVALTLEAGDGIALLGQASLSVDVAAGAVAAVRVPIRADKVGQRELTVVARSGDLADSVRRTLRVVPDGHRVEVVASGTLDTENVAAIELPEAIVEGSAQLMVRLLPGRATLSSEGAADVLQHPSGCFEQTTASAWPNAMALEALASDPDADPATVARARDLVSEGYQRILTFQSADGGFSWWGDGDTPELAVTALGLAELVDTARVHPVDASAIDRAARWLAEHQGPDGSYRSDTHVHCGNDAVGASDHRMTAYVAWALALAEREEATVRSAIAWLEAHAAELDDPYTVALTLEALGASGLPSELEATLAERLRDAQGDDGSVTSEAPTLYYSYGDQGTIENTAVSGLALLGAGHRLDAESAAAFIAQNRQGSYGYGTTQSTVQSLRLLNSIQAGPALDAPIEVGVAFDARPFARETITPDDADVLRQLDLTPLLGSGAHSVVLTATKASSIAYEVALVYYQPWEEAEAEPSHLRLDVGYDRTVLPVGEEVTVTATLGADVDEAMPIVELGLPPGFVVQPELLESAKAQGLLTRWEIQGGRLAIYFDQILAGQPIVVTFALKATLVVDALIPSSALYPYYNPRLRTETESLPIEVVE